MIFGYTVSDKTGDVFRFRVDGSSTNVTKVNDLSDEGFTGNGDDVEGLATRNKNSRAFCGVVGISESDNGGAPDPYFSKLNDTQPPGSDVRRGNTGFRIGNESGLAVANNGVIYNLQASSENPGPRTRLYRITARTGRATPVGPIRNGQYADGLASVNQGIIYASDGRLTDSLYRLNVSNGTLTRVGRMFLRNIDRETDTGLASDGQDVYLLAEKGGLYRLNRFSGRATFLKQVNLPFNGANNDADYEGFAITLGGNCNPFASNPSNIEGPEGLTTPDIASIGFLAFALVSASLKRIFKSK